MEEDSLDCVVTVGVKMEEDSLDCVLVRATSIVMEKDLILQIEY